MGRKNFWADMLPNARRQNRHFMYKSNRIKRCRSGSVGMVVGTAFMLCLSAGPSRNARADEASPKPTKDGVVTEAKSKRKKFDKSLIDNTLRERKSPPIVFGSWPEAESAAPATTPPPQAEPAPDQSQQ